jgi:copper chaperone CopZ
VASLTGVQRVEADLATKKVTIQFDAPATEQTLRARLAEINYPAAAN